MRGNSFGHTFTMTTFGESHGEALGVIIDGMPAGLDVKMDQLLKELERRRPGRLKESTSRNELDSPEVLSGIFEAKTLGTPISIIVRNTNQRSQDYKKLKKEYRPGHADKTTEMKFGHRDYRGGGRASGRETLSRVIAGHFASLIVPDIQFQAYITKLGSFEVKEEFIQKPIIGQLGFADKSQEDDISNYLLDLKEKGESIGGQIHLTIKNCPVGLGEPVFDKLKADLSNAMMSIGSCMGITFGRGVDFSHLLGSEISNNSKNFAGIEGGISNGETIYLDLFFKAPSTIGEKATAGRHDPCILPRVLPVVEAMAKVVIADHFLRQNAFQMH